MATTRALKLAYTSYKSITASNQSPIVIIHGLLGNKMNWRSIAKSLNSRDFGRVFCVDARNHGASPWSEDSSYEAMAEDVLNFIHKLNASNVSIVGHSMGGKIGMTAALIEPTMVDKLVVVDIAPKESVHQADRRLVFSHMAELDIDKRISEAGNVHTLRAQLLKEWEDIVPSLFMRSFLLANLTEVGGKAAWKVNVCVLQKYLDQIFSFPYNLDNGDIKFNGPALFVSGELSTLLQPQDMPCVRHFFPKAKHVEIAGAGHWVHADAPEAFLDAITEFLL